MHLRRPKVKLLQWQQVGASARQSWQRAPPRSLSWKGTQSRPGTGSPRPAGKRKNRSCCLRLVESGQEACRCELHVRGQWWPKRKRARGTGEVPEADQVRIIAPFLSRSELIRADVEGVRSLPLVIFTLSSR